MTNPADAPVIPGLGITNTTRLISPVTLNNDWPALGRLIFIVICVCIGSTMNGFFVSSFFVEHTLKRIGCVFHACIGLSDLILTSLVMPISAVVLLSGQWDNVPVCKSVQFLTEASTYCYSIFFTFVAAEIYCRQCCTSAAYEAFISMRIGCVSIIVFIVSFAVAGVGTYLDLDYDYCQRLHFGDFYFRGTTSIMFHVIPFVLTVYCLLASASYLRHRARIQVQYRRSRQFDRDYSATNLNIIAYIIYVLGWTPYLIVIYKYPNTSDSKYYLCAWIGIFRSLLTVFFYSTLNRSFRRAFAYLFCYCCCKSTVTSSYNNRHRRVLQLGHRTGDVRVHIMHQAVQSRTNDPRRGTSSIRETQGL